MHAKIESKKSIALQQTSSFKTIREREKKDNPILKLYLRVRLLTHERIGKNGW